MTSLVNKNQSGKPSGWQAILQSSQSWPLMVMALYVFLAPNVDFAEKLALHDGQRLAQLLAIGLLILILPASRAKFAFNRVWVNLPNWSRWALGTVLALGMGSALLAPLPRWGLLEWGMSVLLLTTAFAAAGVRLEFGKQIDVVLVMLFFGTALAYSVTTCGVYILMLLVGPVYGQGFDLRELYTSFSNIRFFGHVQTMLLPFLLLPAMYWGTTRFRRVLLWSIPAIWWMLAIGSGTRGTWVALSAGLIVALWIGSGCGRRWAIWQFGGFLAGLFCYAVFVLVIPQFFALPVSFIPRVGDIISLSSREVIWSSAWQFFTENPWLGVGPMHFAYVQNEVAAHPHNAVLQWLAEWGLPAGLLLTGLWAASGLALTNYIRRVADEGDYRARLFRVALLAALTGASAQAMVDGVMAMPVSQMLLALLAGWAIGLMPHPESLPTVSVVERMLPGIVIALATIAVVFGVAPEIGNFSEMQKFYLEGSSEGVKYLPRFWTQGWIRP